MKILKMILRRLGLYSVPKLSNEGYWFDNWEKAEYRIEIYTDDNNTKIFTPQRKEIGFEWESLPNYGENSKEGALKSIENNKKMYREAWNRHYTRKYEYINV